MEEYVYKLLDNSLLFGLKELEFWEMTIAEVMRYLQAQQKIKKAESQEKASYDYILAGLITRGFSIAMGAKQSFPKINEVYGGLFDEIKEEQEEKEKQRIMELSTIRFKQFTKSYNNNFNRRCKD